MPKQEHLKDLAARYGMNVGTCVNSHKLANKLYREAITKEFNLITPEWEMLFKNIHPEKEKYNFSYADKLLLFAKKHELKVRGHPLAWSNSKWGLPNWLKKVKLGKKEAIDILETHIMTVVRRYKQIPEWIVVNEAIDDGARLRRGIWSNSIGKDYLELAFRVAHETNPYTILYYNDYSIDDLNPKSDAVYRLMERLLKKGVPVNAIGLQMHRVERRPLDIREIRTNIKRFQELGLKVSISEMDVRIKEPVTRRKLENQAKMYYEVARAAIDLGCRDFSLWGVSDAVSWIPWAYKGYGAAHIIDKNYKPKPAYEKLIKAFREK